MYQASGLHLLGFNIFWTSVHKRLSSSGILVVEGQNIWSVNHSLGSDLVNCGLHTLQNLDLPLQAC